jgi:perosamine synthetase
MIPLFKVHMPKEVDKPLLEVLHSGYITQGEKVEQFEKKFADMMQYKHVVSVNSGTSALTLALRLAGVGYGDEVVTTPMTCTATNLPILSLGAKPVFADVDSETGLIDPASVLTKITKKTKAIMAVDWGGSPVDVRALMDIGRRYDLRVIVDAAHAIGTHHNGEADFVCYSLQAIKHITTVDGGVLACKSPDAYHRGKVLRWFGIDREAPSTDTRMTKTSKSGVTSST